MHYWGFSVQDSFVYCAHFGQTHIDAMNDINKGKTTAIIELYDWSGNPIKEM